MSRGPRSHSLTNRALAGWPPWSLVLLTITAMGRMSKDVEGLAA